jgi:hypothetical protein
MEELIEFAEWIAENHYKLYNKSKGVCYWMNEDDKKTTSELLKLFKNERTA